MFKYLIIPLVLLILLTVPPWFSAFRSYYHYSFLYSPMQGKAIECTVVDGKYFDRYICLVYDATQAGHVKGDPNRLFVTSDGRRIFVNDSPVVFPKGSNFGWLKPDGQIEFSAIEPKDIKPEPNTAKIYYLFGEIPRFKKFPKGLPRKEFIEDQVNKQMGLPLPNAPKLPVLPRLEPTRGSTSELPKQEWQ